MLCFDTLARPLKPQYKVRRKSCQLCCVRACPDHPELHSGAVYCLKSGTHVTKHSRFDNDTVKGVPDMLAQIEVFFEYTVIIPVHAKSPLFMFWINSTGEKIKISPGEH